MIRLGPLLALVSVVLAGSASAQLRPYYLNPTDYYRIGLEPAWSAHIQHDAVRSEVAAATLSVVGLNSYVQFQQTAQQVFDVTYGEGRVRRFSENDLDRAGRRLGPDEARRLAEKAVILLEARGLNPKLSLRQVPSMALYVQSSGGTLHALDAETGRTLWIRGIGRGRHPALKPAANDQFVAAFRGSQMYLVERTTGRPVWDRPLSHNPKNGAAMSASHVFVPFINGRLEGFRLPDDEGDYAGSPPWAYNGGGVITAVPLVTDTTISWATANSQLLVSSLDGPTMMYRHRTDGPIDGQVAFLMPNLLVFGTTEGDVTAISQDDGLMQWRVSVGEEIRRPVAAIQEQVFATTVQGNLFCISAEDGTHQWLATGISEVLAVGSDRVYGRDHRHRLVAIDRETGDRLGAIPSGAYETAIGNQLTDRIYLVDRSGTLLCLREVGVSNPVLHVSLPEEPAADDSTPRRRTPPTTDTDTSPDTSVDEDGLFGGDDMFGGDDASDMGADDMADDDMAGDDMADDDIFGSADEADPEDASADDTDVDNSFDFGDDAGDDDNPFE